MHSPEPNPATSAAASAAAAAPESAAAQDLTVYDYISNLSPLQPVMPPKLVQGFSGLSSSPLASGLPPIKCNQKTRSRTVPQNSPLSLVEKADNRSVSAKFQFPVGSPRESSEVMATENHSEADSLPKAQRCFSLKSIDERLDRMDVAGKRNLHPSDVKQVDIKPQVVHATDGGVLLDINEESVADIATDYANCLSLDQYGEDLQSNRAMSFELRQKEHRPQLVESTIGGHAYIHTDKCNQPSDLNFNQNEFTGSMCGFTNQLPSKCSSALPVPDHSHDNSSMTEHRCMRKLNLTDFKASEKKPGMLRRCLKFEKKMTDSERLHSSVTGSILPSYLQKDSTQVSMATKSKKDNCLQSARSSVPSHAENKSTSNIFKGTGIGLHLNNVVRTLPSDPVTAPEQKEVYDANIKHLTLANKKRNQITFKGVSCQSSHRVYVAEGSEGTNSGPHSSFGLYGAYTILLNQGNRWLPLLDKRISRSEPDLHPKRAKRERTEPVTDVAGSCRRCRCKRSRCLKLYCDCFAAGMYCSGSCSCEGCSNIPECEDIVLQTKKQITTRNPLAFSPKVIETKSESFPNDVTNDLHLAPALPRHKRGCNCRKSMCLKKYCECYQGKVGCCDGCRCEGCQNLYGKKSESCNSHEAYAEKLEAVSKKYVFSQAHSSNFRYHDFSRVSTAQSQYRSLRSSSMQDCNLSVISRSEKPPKASSNSDSHDVFLNTNKDPIHQASYEWESESNSSEGATNTLHSYDTSRYGHSRSSSPLHLLPMVTDFSALSETSELKYASGDQLCKDDKLSFSWSRSPAVPMIGLSQSTSHPRSNSNNDHNSMEENEPQILNNSTPVNAVNVRSPSHNHFSPGKPLLKLGPTSYGSKTTGKLILKSVFSPSSSSH